MEASRRTSLARELHTGLGRWLEQLIGPTIHGWRLGEVRSAVTFGDHPAFGSVTLAAPSLVDSAGPDQLGGPRLRADQTEANHPSSMRNLVRGSRPFDCG